MRRRAPARRFVLAAMFLAGPASMAAEQGSVRGVVLDAENKAVPGASVTLTLTGGSLGQATPVSATTDARGSFVIANLPPGRYQIRAELTGLGAETKEARVPQGGGVEVVLVLRPRYSDTIVVTASRTAETLISAPATVTVISALEIRARAADNFADLFLGTAGLNVTRLNARDMSFDFRTASGILARSQLVMLDGRSLNQEGFGIVLWDYFPVGFDDVEQVELIGTPGSAVWGANALTGVINVRTKAPKDDVGGAATVGVGSVGVRQGRLRWAQAPGRFSYRASSSYFKEDAWARDPKLPDGSEAPVTAMFGNRGTTQAKVDLRADWEGTPGKVWTAHAGWVDSSGIVHTQTGPNRLADSGSYAVFGGVQYRSDLFEAQVYWNRTRADTNSVLFGDDFKSTTNSVTGEVVAHRAVGRRQAVSFGGSATLTGFHLTLAPGDSFRSSLGGFVEDEIAVTPKLTWTIGSRVDKFDTFGATVSPRTSLVYHPTQNQALRLAVNRAYRAPSLIETFALTRLDNVIPIVPGLPPVVFSTTVRGNHGLNPEVMRAIEVGFTTALGAAASLSATIYFNSLRDKVSFVQTEAYGPGLPPPGWPLPVQFVPVVPKTLTWLNIGNVRDRGLELTGRAGLGHGMSARASYSRHATPTVTKADPRFPLQLNRPPKHQAAVGFVYDNSRWRGSLDGSFTDVAFWSDILDSRFWGTTPSYVQVNARIGYALRGDSARLDLSGTNLFNRRIKQHVFGDIVPRQITAELRLGWGKPGLSPSAAPTSK